ncbi:GMC oxidoreductase family [Rhizoctonia solani]|uniref:GMC oxidoreductase family n=1 Tax=Rhizoctonia solani TaxID=456999 RepID=A0A8H7M7B0_9AGAM|nr:GMC oxidoreductase family [Rhizoctonia solani]
MARSAAKTSALVASTIVFTLGAHAFPRGDTAHNPDNPNRYLLARAITADTSKLDGKTFDFVIVGGGTAGLAMASRLTEYSNMTVAVIEAGGDGSDHADNINIPGYSYLHGLTGSDADWSYTITNQSSAGNRATKWPRGKVLGGSGHKWHVLGIGRHTIGTHGLRSSLLLRRPTTLPNFQTERQHPSHGHGPRSSITTKSETFHAPPAEQQSKYGMTIDADAHGTSGPIQTTMSEFIYDPVSNWVPTLVNVGMKKGDLASGDTNVATITPSTLNPSNFTRSNSLAGYITPVGPRSNLVILTGVQATGLVWSSKKTGGAVATGVNFAASAGGQTYSVKASKEVILCGGVIGSAQLLQVSGVGPKALMDSLKIQSVVDLPGVGQNLQDHGEFSHYLLDVPRTALRPDMIPEATTVTWSVDGATWADLAGNATLQAEQLVEFRESSTGLWTYINEAVAYPNIQNIMGTSADTWISSVSSQLSSALSSLSTAQSLDSTVLKGIAQQFNIQLDMLKNGVGQLEIIMTMLAGAGNVGIQVAQQHAWSRGELRISSASIWDYPTINPNYLSNGWDVDIMNAGIKFVRRVGSTEPMSSYLKTEGGGTSAATTDAAINSYVANSIATGYHPIGTCSMLPLDMGGVVDTTLRVYGTTNVRVIDASVMPIHVTAHTMAPAYAIAEYGADIIKMAYWPVPPSASTTSSKAGGPSGTPDTETGVATGGLSQTQRTAAIAASIGGAAAVAALIAVLFFIRKRGKKANAQEDAYSGAYATDQRRSDLPMQTLSQSDLNAPIAPFKTGGKPDYRMSASTMDTAQLHAATPMQEHQHLHYDDPHSPGYAYGSQTFNPYTDASAPGTPYMGPAPGLNPGNPHEYQHVSGRASPGSNTGARI